METKMNMAANDRTMEAFEASSQSEIQPAVAVFVKIGLCGL